MAVEALEKKGVKAPSERWEPFGAHAKRDN
jgi:hypothetical protein